MIVIILTGIKDSFLRQTLITIILCFTNKNYYDIKNKLSTFILIFTDK
ncbi:hypothetical protein GMMP1_1060015 [Candidatus Magnetomoraceae bacterium gMMP-1]